VTKSSGSARAWAVVRVVTVRYSHNVPQRWAVVPNKRVNLTRKRLSYSGIARRAGYAQHVRRTISPSVPLRDGCRRVSHTSATWYRALARLIRTVVGAVGPIVVPKCHGRSESSLADCGAWLRTDSQMPGDRKGRRRARDASLRSGSQIPRARMSCSSGLQRLDCLCGVNAPRSVPTRERADRPHMVGLCGQVSQAPSPVARGVCIVIERMRYLPVIAFEQAHQPDSREVGVL